MFSTLDKNSATSNNGKIILEFLLLPSFLYFGMWLPNITPLSINETDTPKSRANSFLLIASLLCLLDKFLYIKIGRGENSH